jgi:thiol-disulfide isomerase/thioredoxin
MPRLTAEEVERYVALGKHALERSRAGDKDGAVTAYRRQMSIFPLNHEPYLRIALIESGRGNKKEAIELLREAVVRGFDDLVAVERAEAWTGVRKSTAFHKLQDAIPQLATYERKWPAWDAFGVARTPESLSFVLTRHAELIDRVDEMSPALGAIQTRRWKRLLDRASGAMLEAYAVRNPEAPDLAETLDHLMAKYAGVVLDRWGRLPAGAATRLESVSTMVLDRFPESDRRHAALVGIGLANYAIRDKKNRLPADNARKIREALGEVLADFSDSDVAATAAIELIRTELRVGDTLAAGTALREFRATQPTGSSQLTKVHRDLGATALKLAGLPRFEATTLAGQPIESGALRGKVVVLDFWATWCQPCVEDFRALRAIDEKHGDDHVQDGLGWDSDLVKAFGVQEIPFNVVVGTDGTVVAVNEHGKKLEKAVQRAVAASRS